MREKPLLEVWLRGPLPHLSPYLQPVAHALMQAREEVNALMETFPDERLWERPGGVASVAFHLQHLAGVLDRLFTYAAGKALSREQLEYLAAEGKEATSATTQREATFGKEGPLAGTNSLGQELTGRFNRQVDKALEQLSQIPEQTLTEIRGVGRAQIPSTILGLLVHAAEHTQRHTGQLLVTARVQATPDNKPPFTL